MSLGSFFSGPVMSIIKTVAPTIATVLGGPLAGTAVTFLTKGFGKGGAASTVADIEKALAGGDPETMVKLKQIETDLQKHLADIGVTEEQLRFADIASARSMQTAVKSRTPAVLSYIVICGFLLIAGFEVVTMTLWPEQWGKMPAAAAGTLGTIVGYLLKAASGAETFWFGSSAGSQAKDTTLAEIAKS